MTALFDTVLREPFRWLNRLFQGQREHDRRDGGQPAATYPDSGAALPAVLDDIRNRCTECGACTKACAFLARHGTAKAIATGHDFSDPNHQRIAYECSLCGLCAAVCPEGLDPGRLFLAIRCRHVAEGFFDAGPYRRLLRYERYGCSPLFSWHGLPPGCDTVFFPGCALPGARPEATMEIYRRLRRLLSTLGVVLDCCAKPSHDLGRAAHFGAIFGKMHAALVAQGIRTVLTTCPNCTKIFRQYGEGLEVRTVWEVLHAGGAGPLGNRAGGIEVSVHDPCPLRDDRQVQAAIRGLLADLGYTVVAMPHQENRTVCCGEGGAVGCIDPGLAEEWTGLRGREAENRLLVTSCSGCVAALNRRTPTVHVADLLHRPEVVLSGKAQGARPPVTSWNRLVCKHRFKRMLRAERP